MNAAALAYLILRQQDSVGLITFDSHIRSFLRPSSQPSHLKEIIHVLNRGTSNQKTDRKSTRLNSSHTVISYAVFCLKKKTTTHSTSDPIESKSATTKQKRGLQES